jgi:hypothetical protein
MVLWFHLVHKALEVLCCISLTVQIHPNSECATRRCVWTASSGESGCWQSIEQEVALPLAVNADGYIVPAAMYCWSNSQVYHRYGCMVLSG